MAAGQYINLGLLVGDRFIARSYSLTEANVGHMSILVKRQANGDFTRRLTQLARPGLVLHGYPAAGSFVIDKSKGPLVLIGAGSGIARYVPYVSKQLGRANMFWFCMLHKTKSKHTSQIFLRN